MYAVLRILPAVLLTLGLAATASATPLRVEFSGTIDSLTDLTDEGALSGSGIVPFTSTFSGSFTYDTSTSPTFDDGSLGEYPAGPLSVVIDGVHTFVASSSVFDVLNDRSGRNDGVDVYRTGSPISFPFLFNPDDIVLMFSLEDESRTAFSDTSLPVSLDLADFADFPDRREISIRTDLDRANGKRWVIHGQVEVLSTSVIPEPTTGLLLGLGLAALGLARRQALSLPRRARRRAR